MNNVLDLHQDEIHLITNFIGGGGHEVKKHDKFVDFHIFLKFLD